MCSWNERYQLKYIVENIHADFLYVFFTSNTI